jgi:hypothetical protein
LHLRKPWRACVLGTMTPSFPQTKSTGLESWRNWISDYNKYEYTMYVPLN